jgi:hypothetical protein
MVDGSEDGGVGADAEGQHEDGDQSEAGGLTESSDGVGSVLEEVAGSHAG